MCGPSCIGHRRPRARLFVCVPVHSPRPLLLQERDKAIAEHVMSLHFAENRLAEANDGVDVALLRKYISYCRQRCAPCLTAEASTQLAQEYVKIREGQRK